MTLAITALRVFNDNYAYLLTDRETQSAATIDPGQAGPVIKALEKKNLELTHILLTHHHYDHTGGAEELKKVYPAAKIALHKDDVSHLELKPALKLKDGDSIDFAGTTIKTIHLPCHTRGHVAFRIEDHLFTGDTLFNAGCGKFFEGTAAEMLTNLQQLKSLPPATRIYCGHEYTVENLAYAHRADPDNRKVQNRLQNSRKAQAAGNFMVPSTLAVELQTNPFLRLDDKNLTRQLKTDNQLATLIALYKIYYNVSP